MKVAIQESQPNNRHRQILKKIVLLKKRMTPGNLLIITYAIVLTFIGIVKMVN
ncbi:hypothetical protein OIU83_09540 [Flavobacterium sp. LS1R49]|uniref:Uncharacterized protein n=1 Tax=Flavobacterium shii TaxID=2987687 RepID=A0A9X3BXW0_9FLAO|nr:hypothetical protein [Flavobacterium shii]MCV9927895.1 hypothetical protein [Flavobacterium shii]